MARTSWFQVMWNSAHVMDMVNEAKNFGVETSSGKFDWAYMKEARDSYVRRLNGIYERNLANSGVQVIQGVSACGREHSPAINYAMLELEAFIYRNYLFCGLKVTRGYS